MSDGMPEGTQQPEVDAMQFILQILKDHEERITKVCAAHDDLDKEIHEDFFGPIHEQYQASEKGKRVAGLKDRYGSVLGDISDQQWKGFGIEDLFGRLDEEIQKMQGNEGWGPDSEKGWIDNIHSQALDRIKQISGAPTVAEPAKEEVKEPEAAVTTVEVKKGDEKPPVGKKNMKAKGILNGL